MKTSTIQSTEKTLRLLLTLAILLAHWHGQASHGASAAQKGLEACLCLH